MKRTLLWTLAFWPGLSACSDRGPTRSAAHAIPVPEERLRSAEARTRGQALFRQYCALCHGVRADGRGVRRAGLSKKPTDFTDPTWPLRASPHRVYETIREGVPGTPMPAWKAIEADETWDLVAFLMSVAEGGSTPTPAP